VVSMGRIGYSLICLRSPDPTSSPSETSTQLLLGRGAMIHLADSWWQWDDRGIGVVLLVSGPPIEWMEDLCVGWGEYSLTKSWSLIHWTCWNMDLDRAFIMQGPNRNISRSIKSGLPRAAYLGIQILQNLVTPKKALSCFMVCGSGKWRIGSIHSWLKEQVCSFKTTPR
jgi:hypothetical protein